MPRSSKPIEIDARWVYWRSFLLFFLLSQFVVWHRVSQLPILMPGHRLFVFLLAPWATPQSFAVALLAAGAFTLLSLLIVRFIVRPLWSLWLNPPVDPAWGMFHLSANETIISSLPARRRLGWSWQTGSIALTNRRLWFFPSAWDGETWFMNLDEADRIEREGSIVAQLAPIRNWPVPFRVLGRSGQDSVFAVSDPKAIEAWLRPFAGQVSRPSVGSREIPRAGAIDA
jgi:hypothetical protein